MARHEIIGKAGKSILIALLTDRADKLLWSHIAGRMQIGFLVEFGHVDEASKTEICEQCLTLLIEKNIFWFDAAMQEVLLMSIGECLSYLGNNSQCIL